MGTATAVAGRVGEQSRIFENVGNKVLAVGAKFPAINGVINAVRRKKSKVSWPIMAHVHLLFLMFSAAGSICKLRSLAFAGHYHSGLCDCRLHCLHLDLLDQQALMDQDSSCAI